MSAQRSRAGLGRVANRAVRMTAMTAMAAIALAVARPARAQSKAPVPALPSDSAIRAVLKTRVDSGAAGGMIVGIVENGRRRYVAYGSAGPGRPALDEHTIFEIGSISKTFTALL